MITPQGSTKVQTQANILINSSINNAEDQVKLEDNVSCSSNGVNKRQRKPKFMNFESLRASRASQKLSQSSVSQSAEPKVKFEPKTSQYGQQIVSEFGIKQNSTDPTEQDLCEALMIIKKKLHHRSLQKAIIKLYERAKEEKDRISTVPLDTSTLMNLSSKNALAESTVKLVGEGEQWLPKKGEQITPIEESRVSDDRGSRTQKILLLGKKCSPYHDNSNSITSPSNDYYQNNPPRLQDLKNLENSLNNQSINNQPAFYTAVVQGSPMQQQIFKLAKNNSNRSHLVGKQTEQYEIKRKVADVFIRKGLSQRGEAYHEFPDLNINRKKFRSMMRGVFKSAFRKMQSFMTGQIQMSIKYLDNDQMHKLSQTLLSCRMHLSPKTCETYFKFMKASLGLQEVTVSKTEVIQAYVNILKHIHGQNITINQLQRMGRVDSHRKLQDTVKKFKRHAQTQSQSQSRRLSPSTVSLWSGSIDRKLINLRLSGEHLGSIKGDLESTYRQLQQANYKQSDFENRLEVLTRNSLSQVQVDSQELAEGVQLPFIGENQTKWIITSPEAASLRTQLLNYSLTETEADLKECIQKIQQILGTSKQSSQLKGHKDWQQQKSDAFEQFDTNVLEKLQFEQHSDISR